MHEQSQSNHSEKGEQYIGVYFKEFHPFWPFIHRASFNMRRETPLLLQSMTVIGLWASGEPNAQSAAVEIHGKLDLAIHDQKVRSSRMTPHSAQFDWFDIQRRIGMFRMKMKHPAPLPGL